MSMALVFALIYFFVPWQVAFSGCWLIHLYTCATSIISPVDMTELRPSTPAGAAIPLVGSEGEDREVETKESLKRAVDGHNQNLHVLLLMTCLLPLVTPAL